MKSKSFNFIIISGCGWLIDLGTITLLVNFNIEPLIANLCSASLAVTFVYWISRVVVFDKRIDRKAVHGYAAYYGYSLIVIALFSMLIQYLTHLLYTNASDLITFTASAFIVKIIVTPFNLYVNFVVSKYIVGKT